MFVCCLSSLSRNFIGMETSPLPVKGLCLAPTPSSIKGSFECHTYCDTGECHTYCDTGECHTYRDTGHQFLWISPRTCVSHTYYRALGRGAITTCFNDIRLSQLGFKHPIFRLRDKCSNQLHYCHSQFFVIESSSN